MENEEKVHDLSLLIENVLYKRLAVRDEDDRTDYKEKQKIKRRLIREFINNLPETYREMENLNKITKELLTKMNQYVEWEDEKKVSNEIISGQIQKPQGSIDNEEELER